jgi:hypothetical protein
MAKPTIRINTQTNCKGAGGRRNRILYMVKCFCLFDNY